MSCIASEALSLVYRDVEGLALPPGTALVVSAVVEGCHRYRAVSLDALFAVLAQLPRGARQVTIIRPVPVGKVDAEIMARYAQWAS